MRKRQGPETQVGGGVRDASQHVFDGLDDLVDEQLSESLFLFFRGLRVPGLHGGVLLCLQILIVLQIEQMLLKIVVHRLVKVTLNL